MEKMQIKRILYKVMAFLLMLSFKGFYAQSVPATPPAAPPAPGGSGVGAVGPGVVDDVPIHMYEYGLLGIALVFIVTYYFHSLRKEKML